MTPETAIDANTLLARPDLAEQALEGLVPAGAYRATTAMHARTAVLDIEATSERGSGRLDQILFGEIFDVLDRKDGRVWGRARRTGTVGWTDADGLGRGSPLALFTVSTIDAVLPLNALVHHGYSGVSAEALKPTGVFEADHVAVAERLVDVPHSLGARSSRLTDCSGLVQTALFACGRACPRQSADQAEMGREISQGEIARGDLVVWLAPEGETGFTGHSALVLDAATVIHATGHHGRVVIESLAEAMARYGADGFRPPAFRRLEA